MHITIIATRRHVAVACMAMGLTAHAGIAVAEDDGDIYEEHALEEIIVEGIPLDRTISELAQPTAVVGGDRLTKLQAASLGETLANELGVSSTYFGPVSSRPVIRGQYGERIRILSNSLDSMDASALSSDHAVSVDSMLAKHVEIIRGPATLLYGSGAAGGLINVVDDRILENGLEEGFDSRVTLGTDSATGMQAAAGEVAFGTENVVFHLDYFHRETDDIEIPGFAESSRLRALEEEDHDHDDDHDHDAGHDDHDEEEEAFGRVENTSSEANGAAAAVTFSGENGYLGLVLSNYDNLYGIPGHHHGHEDEDHDDTGMHDDDHDHEHEEEEERVRVDLDQSRFDLRGEYRFADLGKLRLKFASNDYKHVELEGDEIGTMFDTEGTDTRVEFNHRPFGELEGAFGFQHKDIDFIAIGDEAYVPQSSTKQTSLFVFEEWQADDRWTLQGSARFESQTIDSPELPRYDDNAFGASVGLIRSLNDDHSLALNFSLTERHPNATELYADGAHVAVQRIERGSVTQGEGLFAKETTSNIDLTLRGQNPRVEWTVTTFLNDADNYILLTPTAMMEDELQVFEYVQTDARLYGFEAEARVELLDSAAGHLHTRLFSDFVYGEDENTGAYLPRIPALRYGASLHFQKRGFEAIAEATFHADRDKIAANELPTDSYTLLNLEMSYEFGDPDVFVFLRGTNLTDEDARQHASPLKDRVPLPGRSLQLGLRYDF